MRAHAKRNNVQGAFRRFFILNPRRFYPTHAATSCATRANHDSRPGPTTLNYAESLCSSECLRVAGYGSDLRTSLVPTECKSSWPGAAAAGNAHHLDSEDSQPDC